MQQGGDAPVAVAAILTGQPHYCRRERILVGRNNGYMALGRACLAKHPAGPAFGDAKGLLDLRDAGAAPLGAQNFPRAASYRISLSSVRSTTALRRRWFSRSSSLSRLA